MKQDIVSKAEGESEGPSVTGRHYGFGVHFDCTQHNHMAKQLATLLYIQYCSQLGCAAIHGLTKGQGHAFERNSNCSEGCRGGHGYRSCFWTSCATKASTQTISWPRVQATIKLEQLIKSQQVGNDVLHTSQTCVRNCLCRTSLASLQTIWHDASTLNCTAKWYCLQVCR